MLRSARLVASSRRSTRLPHAVRACLVVDSQPSTSSSSRCNSTSAASGRHGLSFGPMRKREPPKPQPTSQSSPSPSSLEEQPPPSSTASSSSQPAPQTHTSHTSPPPSAEHEQRPPISHAASQSAGKRQFDDQSTGPAPGLANGAEHGNSHPNRFSYSNDLFGAPQPPATSTESAHQNARPVPQHSSPQEGRPSETATSSRHGLSFGPTRRPAPQPQVATPPPHPSQTQSPSPQQRRPETAAVGSTVSPPSRLEPSQPPQAAPNTGTAGNRLAGEGLSFGLPRNPSSNSQQPTSRHGLSFGPMRKAATNSESRDAEQGRALDPFQLPSGSSRPGNSGRHGLNFGPMRSRGAAESGSEARDPVQRPDFDANIFGSLRSRTSSDRESRAGSRRGEGAFQGQRDSLPPNRGYGHGNRGGNFGRRDFDRQDPRNGRRDYGRQDQPQRTRGGERWHSAPSPESAAGSRESASLGGSRGRNAANNEPRWTSSDGEPRRGRGLGYNEERPSDQPSRPNGEQQHQKPPSSKVWSTPDEERPMKRQVEEQERVFTRPLQRRSVRESETDRRLREIAQGPKEVFLPEMISVNNLSRLVGTRPAKLRQTMLQAGLTDTIPAALLKFDDAALICAEFNLNAVSNDEAAFDIYPAVTPTPEEKAALPLRPPVVTVMGHVDHGKTSLLDRLRSASVAAGEAGGITQHIGAFSVPVKAAAGTSDANSVNKITFLDTPGHAAFSNMRARGAKATDIVVLVVAADDGVMTQTKEVIQLYHSLEAEARASAEAEGSSDANKNGDATKGKKKNNIQLMVALSKCDRPAANVQRAKEQLAVEGIYVEDLNGDVPCVEISSKTGQGFDTLEETLAVMAELGELRSAKTGSPEGIVLESRTEKGLGNTATVLVTRGELKPGSFLIAGTSWAKVRGMVNSNGKSVKNAGPSEAVLVSGWRELPEAGEEVLSAAKEDMIKRAVENRKASHTRRQMVKEAEAINEARRKQREEAEKAAEAEHEERLRIRRLWLAENRRQELGEEGASEAFNEERDEDSPDEDNKPSTEIREVRVVIKSDFSGTGEALEGAISGLVLSTSGYTAKVKVISMGVGDLSDGDVAMAKAAVDGDHRVALLGFNVKSGRSIQQAAKNNGIEVFSSPIIYEIIDYMKSSLSGVLPGTIETRVTGEATIAQIFSIAGNKGKGLKVAGSKVTNGVIARANKVRVLRASLKTDENGEKILETIFEGHLSSLRQVKKEVSEMRKGTECGISFDGFDGFEEGDLIRAIEQTEVPVSFR